jgi:hypothetical protein
MRLPLTGLNRSQWLRLADAAGLTALAVVALAVAVGAYTYQGGDFRAFYAASTVALTGGNPYDYSEVSSVLWTLAGQGSNTGPYFPPYFYYYPPWLCLLLSPLALFQFQVARAVWLALNVAMLGAGSLLFALAAGWRPRGWQVGVAGMAVLYPLGWVALGSEQLGAFTFFWLALAAFLLTRPRDPAKQHVSAMVAGLALALAITKPQDGLLIAVVIVALFWRQGRRQVPAALVAALAALLLISSLLLPQWWAKMDAATLVANLTGQAQPSGVVVQRVSASLLDWLAPLGVSGIAAGAVYLALALAVAAVLLHGLRNAWPDGSMVAYVSVSAFLLSPYAYEYDYVVMLPALLWALWGVMNARHHRLILAQGLLLLAFTTSHLWGHWMSDAYWSPILLAALLLLQRLHGTPAGNRELTARASRG